MLKGGLTMDLTNIKPCVECKNVEKCRMRETLYQSAFNRICFLVYEGKDCFEEVDDGQNS